MTIRTLILGLFFCITTPAIAAENPTVQAATCGIYRADAGDWLHQKYLPGYGKRIVVLSNADIALAKFQLAMMTDHGATTLDASAVAKIYEAFVIEREGTEIDIETIRFYVDKLAQYCKPTREYLEIIIGLEKQLKLASELLSEIERSIDASRELYEISDLIKKHPKVGDKDKKVELPTPPRHSRGGRLFTEPAQGASSAPVASPRGAASAAFLYGQE